MKWLSILLIFFLYEAKIFCNQLFTSRGKSQASDYWSLWPYHQVRRLVCISDNPYDAIVWNTNVQWEHTKPAYKDRERVSQPKLSNPVPNTIGIGCAFDSESDQCFSKWLQSGPRWQVVRSLEEPMGPIFDSRWEDLQEFSTFTTSDRKKFKHITTFNDTGAIVVSIRGVGNAHFLLCTTPNYSTDFCYWIILGGWHNTPVPSSGVRKCMYGVGDGSAPGDSACMTLHQNRSNYQPLSKDVWKTFILTWQEANRAINIYDRDRSVLSFTDNQPPKVNNQSSQKYHLFFDNPQDDIAKIYRLHNYSYTLVKQPNAELSARFELIDSNDICIDMLIGLCAKCNLEISIMDGNNRSLISSLFRDNFLPPKAAYDLPLWQHAKIKFKNITAYSSPFSIKLVTRLTGNDSSLNHHWAIANVRECFPKGTAKTISMIAVQDYNSKYFWPKVMCQKLSYDDENEMIVDPDRNPRASVQPPEFTNDSQLCQESYFGPHCATRCNEYFSSDCRDVIMCNKQECYCPQGIQEDNCDSRCDKGNYGYNCLKTCGSCSEKYENKHLCDIFTGKCSECQLFSDKYLIPPYCKFNEAIKAPSIPCIMNITTSSVQVSNTIQSYNNIDASFVFELRNNDNGDYLYLNADEIDKSKSSLSKSLNAIFSNLTAGTQYSVRMSISMKSNGYNLAGAWGNFTTLCRKATHYILTPDERSLTLTKIPNEKTPDSCPDTWYKIKLFWRKNHQLQDSSSTFTVNFTNLKPYEDYEVEVMGVDGNVHFNGQVRTLEAAPSEVRELRKDYATSTTAKITWSEPASPNGLIIGYTIRIEPHYHKGCVDKKSSKLNLEPAKSIKLGEHAASHIIADLMPYLGYHITVSAYNSKPGIERTIAIETTPFEIPTEKWVNLTFTPEISKLSWIDPDCTTWTGLVNGSKLFFTGVSPNVKDFHDDHVTPWHTFQLNNTKPQTIHGLETYNVKVHLLHNYNIENYNPEIFAETNFITPPSAPPKVQNLEIVEVDSANQLISLRWQKPLSPTNGRISGYKIRISASRQLWKTFKIYANETCYLWENWLCKTVNRTYTSSGRIQVIARNEGVKKSGEVSEISNLIVEQVPDKPQDVTPLASENGIVDLTWRHPWITGIPITAFKIHREVLRTNLSRPLQTNENTAVIDVPIATYEKTYNTRMYLLPSTLYEIKIQGVGHNAEGKMETVEVKTESALDFGLLRQPIINDQGSQIDIFIPVILNDTTDNIIHIILLGPKPCSASFPLAKSLAKDLNLKPDISAWLIATIPTSATENTPFTIGNDKLHDSIANCPLPNGTYEIAFVVHNRHRKGSDKSVELLHWRSMKVQIGPMRRTAHEAWIVPLVVLLTAAAGIVWFYSKKRNQNARGKRKELSHDVFPPIIAPRQQPKSLYQETSLLVASRESITGVCDPVQTPDVVPVSEQMNENDSCSTFIKLKEFQDYVKNGIASGKLNAQYATFPRGQTKPWEYGQLPANKPKNRYANLIAYDETRVKLEKLPDDPYSDYINANYIKGYQKNKAYIATQGPRPNTVNDFWRMIWQERVQVICMLANVLEGGKKKCEEYWPEIGREFTFGNITVHNMSHTTFADYTFRTFSVTCDQETRKIEHLHYTAWPDHGVPLYIQSVVTYLKKLLATPQGHGPIVVHCSAGIGRTGTIILCDICLRKAAAQGAVDVFAETKAIRNQRANMVDNKQQYLLAHLALVECLLSLPTAIPCTDTLPTRIQEYKTQLSLQQQRLNESAWQDQALQSETHGPIEISRNNIAKNRYPELAAIIGPTLHLSRYPTTDDDSNYIFGVYVDSAMRKNNYIVSQLPLPSTLNDFWRMVAEFNVELIIVLQPPDDKDPTCCEFVPEFDEELNPTAFLNFKGRNFIDEDICTNRKILLTDSSTKPAKEKQITVLSLKGWEPGKDRSPPKPITLVNFWQYAERIPRGDGPTVVLCHDGVTNCGLYVALSFLLERMGLERECDVCLAIRAIRRSRPDFCKALAQFGYLYDTALIYADYFETYANFT